MFKSIIAIWQLIILCILIFFQGKAYSQIELSVLTGYLSTSNIPVTKGDIDIKSNANYGLNINYYITREISLAVDWDMQKSSADLLYSNGDRKFLTNTTNHHFLAGFILEKRRWKIRPFGSITIGATVFHPEKNEYEDAVNFTIALGLGGKIFISENIGFKLQTRLILPLQFNGGSFWCGTGGCGLGVGSYSTFVQGEINGGIVIKI